MRWVLRNNPTKDDDIKYQTQNEKDSLLVKAKSEPDTTWQFHYEAIGVNFHTKLL